MRLYLLIFLILPTFIFPQYKEIPRQRIKDISNTFFYKHKPLNGKYKIYNKRNREDYEISNYVNGRKNDSVAITTTSKGRYLNGLKEGKWSSTYSDGKLYDISNYKNGKKNGETIKFSYNGILQDTLTYKNDKLEGWQIFGKENAKRKELYENGELKESIERSNDGSFYAKLKYVKLSLQEYSYGIEEFKKNGRKFSDSITLNFDNKNIEKIIYTKLNDSLYHKIQISRNRSSNGVTVKFFNKKNILYMKYIFSYIYDSEDKILFDSFYYHTHYDEKTQILKVNFCNPCEIWEKLNNKNFTVYTYNDKNEERYYYVRWLKSDGDMLADFCVPKAECKE